MQPRQAQSIGVKQSQSGKHSVGHAEIQRSAPAGGNRNSTTMTICVVSLT